MKFESVLLPLTNEKSFPCSNSPFCVATAPSTAPSPPLLPSLLQVLGSSPRNLVLLRLSSLALAAVARNPRREDYGSRDRAEPPAGAARVGDGAEGGARGKKGGFVRRPAGWRPRLRPAHSALLAPAHCAAVSVAAAGRTVCGGDLQGECGGRALPVTYLLCDLGQVS